MIAIVRAPIIPSRRQGTVPLIIADAIERLDILEAEYDASCLMANIMSYSSGPANNKRSMLYYAVSGLNLTSFDYNVQCLSDTLSSLYSYDSNLSQSILYSSAKVIVDNGGKSPMDCLSETLISFFNSNA